MTTLERHCRILLLAYPAAYRRERAEEMLGTLLETTPQGRTWPLSRDVRALLVGGLRTRLAPKRRLTVRTNLRTAVSAGLAAYLGAITVETISDFTRGAVAEGWSRELRFFGWPPLIATALIAAAVILAVADGRRVAVLAAALPGAAFLCFAAASRFGAGTFTVLGCLALLTALAGRSARLERWWGVPVGVVAASPLLLMYGQGIQGTRLFIGVPVAIGALSLVSIPIDARPAIAACVLVLAFWLPLSIENFGLSSGGSLVLVPTAIVIAIAALAAWRLRSQSAGIPRRRI
jgi:hypothetical protein